MASDGTIVIKRIKKGGHGGHHGNDAAVQRDITQPRNVVGTEDHNGFESPGAKEQPSISMSIRTAQRSAPAVTRFRPRIGMPSPVLLPAKRVVCADVPGEWLSA